MMNDLTLVIPAKKESETLPLVLESLKKLKIKTIISLKNDDLDTINCIIKNKYGSDISIAGVATGAIAVGAMISERLNVPYAYVRPEPKGHGLRNQVEGNIEEVINEAV